MYYNVYHHKHLSEKSFTLSGDFSSMVKPRLGLRKPQGHAFPRSTGVHKIMTFEIITEAYLST